MAGLRGIFVVTTVVISLLEPAELAKPKPTPKVTPVLLQTPKRNCREIQRQGSNENGVYTIFPYECCPTRSVKVYCDMETDGGGWTVIQRRDDITPREDFYRTWIEYALGFGDLTGEFWLGLDHIHALTDQTLNQIRFDLWDFEDNSSYAEYKLFYIHDRDNSFIVEVNGFSGTAGDSFSGTNGIPFTTKDKDLDTWVGNCAEQFQGAWWYLDCHSSNLNGLYLSGNHVSYADGINWYTMHGHYYSLRKTEMKIRPAY